MANYVELDTDIVVEIQEEMSWLEELEWQLAVAHRNNDTVRTRELAQAIKDQREVVRELELGGE